MRSLTIILFFTVSLYSQQLSPITNNLAKVLENSASNDEIKIWVYFKDKNIPEKNNYKVTDLITERAASRRAKVVPNNKIVDERDFPVNNEYVNYLRSKVSQIRHISKWFNAISCYATPAQISHISKLQFVKKIDLVANYGKKKEEIVEDISESQLENSVIDIENYGTSRKQVDQINVIPLHNKGIRGDGVIVGVFDNGFRLMAHEAFAQMNILSKYDFVDNDPNPDIVPSGAGGHGVNTLSTIGGYKPGQLVGPAYKATFLLARTENDFSETPVEEDNWVRAIEWAESLGVDVTSTSLGYLTYDPPYTSWTWQDMNGNTTLITQAANRADSLGVVVVNSAGNEASVGTPNTLVAPADGFGVLSVGAVDSFGVRSSFSSYGPSYDGRIKPDVMAMGTAVKVASSSSTTGYSRANGTSFSCPLAAGVAALILSAHPSLTPAQVRTAMKMTASKWKTPDNYYGFGILNAAAAVDYFKPYVLHNPLTGIKSQNPQTILVYINSVIPLQLDSCRVYYGTNGSFTASVPLIPTGNPDEYVTELPGFNLGDVVNYYIKVKNVDNDEVKLPSDAPINYYFYAIGGTNLIFSTYEGWNLISIPLILDNDDVSVIFPNATSKVYTYESNQYIEKTNLENGKAYWVKFDTDSDISISGFVKNQDTINLIKGWNMIGSSLLSPVNIENIIQEPPDNIISNFYFYNLDHYEMTNLLYPKIGYWVKVRNNGKLIIRP